MEREYKRSRRCKNKKDSAEQIFMRTLRRSVFSMILCTACLVSSTWAWFVASAESQVAVIRFQEATGTLTATMSTYSRRAKPAVIERGEDGRYELEAGSYTFTVEPVSGTAPMYCLIDIEAEEISDEEIELLVEELDEDWLPVYATDSNAIMLLDEEEFDEYWSELEEDADSEAFEYDVLPISAVKDGVYRVTWEPEEERMFVLNLEADASVAFEIFWMTDEAEEEEYPELDELSTRNYVIVRSKNEASPSEAIRITSISPAINPTTESSAATEGSLTASGGSTENSSEAATEESSNGMNATTVSTEMESSGADVENTTTTTAADESTTSGESGSVASTEVRTSKEQTTADTSEDVTETPAQTQAETQNESEKSEPVSQETEKENEQNEPAIVIDDDGNNGSGSDTGKITPEDSTEKIECLGN